MNDKSIFHIITRIAVPVILVTFTACGGKSASTPAPPPVQNNNREVIILMPQIEGQTVPGGRQSNSAIKEVISPCL